MHNGRKKTKPSYSKSKYLESAIDYETEIIDDVLKGLDYLNSLRFI